MVTIKKTEGDRMRKRKTGLKQKSYVIAAVIMLAAAFGMTGIYYSQQNKKQEEKLAKEQEELQEQEAKKAQEQEELEAKQQAAREEQEQQTEAVSGVIPPQNNDFMDAPEAVAEKEPVVQSEELHFDAENMSWPLQGNVIMNYSMDQTIYFATLDQYKYNPAVIIQAEVNTPVEAVAAGEVTSIDTSAETGTTVTVDMGDGYSAVYGQLKEISWNTGDRIEAGETVGYISEPTKYYSVEGANLYFELLKDGAPVNPMEYLE